MNRSRTQSSVRRQPRPRLKRQPAADVGTFQRQFFARMGELQQFQQLFEHLPGVYFFVKDRRSRMVCGSQPFWEHLGAKSEAEIIGKTDDEFFPPHAADHFRRDDQLVMTTGQPLIGRVELWYNEQQVLDWFVTNKLPVRDARGRIIGVMGIVRSYAGQRRTMLPMSQINSTVDFIREHHHERLTVEELADHAGLSPRQLHRKFREVFSLSVQDFLIKTRIQSASDALLHSGMSIAQIADDFGFCDQSAFTQQFRKHTGLTPLKFRRRYSTPA
ncbi:MAG TPA: AraC family transcriptional regulator [Planctomycetaceae bacterium]|nr:AraC family transcriptional regulator [Planctomycetaceae bacterium]